MGPRLITAAFSLSLLIPLLPATAIAQQSPLVWVDAKGNVHSSPPEPLPSDAPSVTPTPKGATQTTAPSATNPTQTLPSYVQPGDPSVVPSLPARNTEPEPTATRGIHYVHYVPWKDPAEGAFSVSLPEDWHISGGTVRTTHSEMHYVVHAESPDGGVHLFFDSPLVIRPQDQAASAAGLYMGPVIPATAGANLPMDPYHPGNEFAADYVRKLVCPAAEDMHGGPLGDQTQDLTRLFSSIAQAEAVPIHANAGEVAFRCGSSIGYVYAITTEARQPGEASPRWAAYRVAGYLATPADAALAAHTVNRMLATFEIDQAWLQNYAQQDGDNAGNILRASDAIAQSMKDRREAMHAAWQASLAGTRSEVASISGVPAPAADSGHGRDYTARLQTKEVCDDLGRCQTVSAAIDNWYSDCSGRFYPGPASGGPPPADLSACWSKGH